MRERGLADTSVLIGIESGRVQEALPPETWISSITLAELYLGVHAADDPEEREQRLATLAFAERGFRGIPVDDEVARAFARIVDAARRTRRKAPVLDALIAATALSRGLPLYTQDADFHAFPEIDIIRI